jgi:hypothetical protein
MNAPLSLSRPSGVEDRALGDLLDKLAARVQAGESVDMEAVIAANPDYAERLRRLLPAVHMLAGLGHPADSGDGAAATAEGNNDPGPERLGDFRIVREVGRGGMGVVYEAVQLSLNRRVALKMLSFAGALDAKQLRRFQNEAQAAANLQHQHIVPVHFVGCERGVHFYAMQYIDGQTLAQVIAELRRSAEGEPAPTCRPTARLAGRYRKGRPPPLTARPRRCPDRFPRPRTRSLKRGWRPSARTARRATSGRWPGSGSRRPRRCIMPTRWAWSTAT